MRRPALRIIIGRLSLALAVAMIAATWSSQALGADSRLKRAGEAIKDKIFGSRLLTSAFKRVALRAAIKAYGPRPEGALPVEPMMGRETLSSFHYDTKHKVYMGAFNVGTMFFGTLDHVKPIAVGIKPSVIAAAKGNAVRTTILPNDWLLRTSWSQVKSHSVQVPVD